MNALAQTKAEESIASNKLQTTPGKRGYAENLYKISGFPNMDPSEAAKKAVNSWYSSVKSYNYEAPKATGFSQVVWNATTQLGVGVASKDDITVVACTYSPRGNVVLQNGNPKDLYYYFSRNVFPPTNP